MSLAHAENAREEKRRREALRRPQAVCSFGAEYYVGFAVSDGFAASASPLRLPFFLSVLCANPFLII